MKKNISNKIYKIETTNKTVISCNGYDKYSYHPKVYYTLSSPKDEIICQYCSKKFIKI